MDQLKEQIYSAIFDNPQDRSKLLSIIANLMTMLNSDLTDVGGLIANVSEKKELYTAAGPFDYLKILMDEMGNGITWSKSRYRFNMECPENELIFRKMITAIENKDMVAYKEIHKDISSKQCKLFNINEVNLVAMKLSALYNNLELLLEFSFLPHFEPSHCLVHSIIGNANDCFYFLLGSSKYKSQNMIHIRDAFTIAIVLNRLRYVKDMRAVWPNNFDVRYLGAMKLTDEMRKIIEKL